MSKFGRKIANMTSIVIMIIGWACIVFATDISMMIIARLLQGLSMGMSTSLAPILIGEYTSPKNRGAFLTTMGLSMSTGTLIVHTVGSYMTWQWTALICAIITLGDLLIVTFSPESPSWLADKGKYEKCRKVFRWLRGEEEDDELNKMIESNKTAKEMANGTTAAKSFKKRFRTNVVYIKKTITLKEFYKPIFIMAHMYIIAHWAGINLLSTYTLDTFHYVIGEDTNDALLIITLDIQRIISNIGAIFVIRKLKRRTMLFSTMAINILALLVTSLYTYLKINSLLSFDHQLIGILLIHVHTFAVVTGSLPLPMVISGEIFPLKFRSLAGGLSALFYSLNFFITVKTVPILFVNIGVYGAYLLYGVVLIYCVVVLWFSLPETKDKTLQDIENEFKGKTDDDLKSAEPLTLLKSVD